MNLTDKEIKILYQYQLCASLMNEYFKYAEPILRKIEADKYFNRELMRKAMKQYDKSILTHKTWLLGTANILEKQNENEAEIFIDKATDLLNDIKITFV